MYFYIDLNDSDVLMSYNDHLINSSNNIEDNQ